MKKKDLYLEDARIHYLSLVKSAANRREFLTRKSADGNSVDVVQVPIFKSDDGSEDGVRYVTGVAYEPGVIDTDGEQMTATEIAKMAHRYMRDYRGVDIQHSNQQADDCWLAESTVHKSATQIAGQPIPAGAWTVTVGIENPDVIAKVDSGEINGFSIGGFARRVAKAETPLEPQGEQSMFRKLFAWLGESLGLLKPTQATDAETPAEVPTEAPKQTAPPAQTVPPELKPVESKPDTQGQTGTTNEPNRQEVSHTMTAEELNTVFDAMREALASKGMIEQKPAQPAAAAPGAQGAPGAAVQKAAEEAANEPEAVQKTEAVQKAEDGPVEKAAEESVSAENTDIVATIRKAVQEEIQTVKDTVSALAKSHNMATNANSKDGVSGTVEKSGHYMDGFFSV